MEEYIKKLENEVKWMTRRERYLRSNLALLIEMVEGLLEDPDHAHCPSFGEILGDMKLRDLREPWQVKIEEPPIKGPSNVRVRVETKPVSHDGIILDPTDGEIVTPAFVRAAHERLKAMADEEEE